MMYFALITCLLALAIGIWFSVQAWVASRIERYEASLQSIRNVEADRTSGRLAITYLSRSRGLSGVKRIQSLRLGLNEITLRDRDSVGAEMAEAALARI